MHIKYVKPERDENGFFQVINKKHSKVLVSINHYCDIFIEISFHYLLLNDEKWGVCQFTNKT